MKKEYTMARKHLLAHLAHAELITTNLEGSVAFFRDVIGMDEAGRDSTSVYMRCWGDYYQHSLILTPGDKPALGHGAWRTNGPEELEQAIASIEATGTKGQWHDGSLGHGRAYRFKGPGGHTMEIFWEVERFKAPPELRSTYPDRPQHHGSRDLGLSADFSGVPGRMHHLAFWMENAEALLRAADLLVEAGTQIEFGPGRHGIGEQMYLYLREPGGLRIELNSLGYRNYVPDWEPTRWTGEQAANSMYRNLAMPDSMLEAFPPAPGPVVGEPELAMSTSINPWVNKQKQEQGQQ
jgi:catechol 2,3-dioxygenase